MAVLFNNEPDELPNNYFIHRLVRFKSIYEKDFMMNYNREEDKNKRVLVIVDPQNDFIEGGSLPVEGAKKAMDDLVWYLSKNHDIYTKIYVTKDYHPYNHCSFTDNGGSWPKHCVQNTEGCNIYEPLKKVLDSDSVKDRVCYCYKGISSDRDQYSVFDNDEDGNPQNHAGQVIKKEITEMQTECGEEWVHIFVAGIAGDICVANTIRDMLKFVKPEQVTLFRNFQASIDKDVTVVTLGIKEGINIGLVPIRVLYNIKREL